MYKTQQIRLKNVVPDNVRDLVLLMCEHANQLTNCTIFKIRQKHFEVCERNEFFDEDGFFRSEFKTAKVKSVSYARLCEDLKENPHYKLLGGQQAKQTIKSVVEAFTSYNKLLPLFFKGELNGRKPQMPNYRKKDGLSVVTIPAQALKFDMETGCCRIPISRELSGDVDGEIWLPGGSGFKTHQVVELRILPRNRELYAEYVYEDGSDGASCLLALDHSQAIGIDPGVDNWMSVVSTLGKSFIIDGKKLKSLNQRYNRAVAKIQSGKDAKHWDDKLAKLTEERNRVMRDAINKTARFIVNYCLEHKIGTVIFGWGQGVKTEVNLGRRNNQNFVQIPTAKLKERIRQLCEETGIQFHETEESYTSKTSYLDSDFLPVYGGEKPANWEPSGKRGKKGDGLGRGQYKTAKGLLINSDLNGACNIIKKVAIQLGISLVKVGRDCLTSPKRYDVFSSLTKLYRERCEARIKQSYGACL